MIGRLIAKTLITALVITGVSELGKRSSVLGAILASLPLTSILAMGWLYLDTGDVARVAELATGILWAVLASLPFFVCLPFLIRAGVRFIPAMAISIGTMATGYAAYAWIASRMGTAPGS